MKLSIWRLWQGFQFQVLARDALVDYNLVFNELVIAVRAKEWASAESSLRHIIKSCVLHSIALNCLQSLLHGCPTVDMKVIMEHYRMLCTRFPT